MNDCPHRLVALISACFLTLGSCAAFGVTAPPGFKSLYNGQDLAGWWGADTVDPRSYIDLPNDELKRKREGTLENIKAHWKAEGDELVNDGKGLYLTTEEFFGDFELLVDYKTVPKADSGVYLRGCPQVQIWDSTDEGKFGFGADKGSGGLWNNSPNAAGKDPLVKADKPFGEWNHFRIIMVGSRVWVWLNGQPTVQGANMENYYNGKLPIPARGPIQLQTHGGEIRWRNIFLRKIDSPEAIKLLRGKDPAGFERVFNGRNFAGWKGPVENYSVIGGAIQCRPGKGGTIYTAAEYGDFVVRFEFKLPPGGNNGLAIRYPGEGDTAYGGMCELQVLDDNYEQAKGQKIDARQAHGSAYGMVAAQRGFQFPIGQWNYQEVTVKGSCIKVELNGTAILNCDLSKITTYMGDNAHPGKDRATGHFGFAGHNDPVAFRNITIQKL